MNPVNKKINIIDMSKEKNKNSFEEKLKTLSNIKINTNKEIIILLAKEIIEKVSNFKNKVDLNELKKHTVNMNEVISELDKMLF